MNIFTNISLHAFEFGLNNLYKANSSDGRSNLYYVYKISGLRWFTSKQPKLGLTQELSFSLELVSPLQVTHLPPVWDLLLPLA